LFDSKIFDARQKAWGGIFCDLQIFKGPVAEKFLC